MVFLEAPGIALRKIKEEFFCHKMAKRYPLFAKADKAFQLSYKGINRYTLCRRYFESLQAKDPYVYGETFLETFSQLAILLNLGAKDLVLDLGCGAGRGLFFLKGVYGCSGIGIDIVPEFIAKAQKLSLDLNLQDRLQFYCQDLKTATLKPASVVYIAGTCFEEGLTEKLILQFLGMSSTTYFVSVSEALSEHNAGFKVVKEMPARFLWGKTTLYIEQKI